MALTFAFCALALASCRKEPASAKVIVGPPQTGALYSLSDNEGGFRVGKVIAVEDEVVFVTLYGDRWTERPALAVAHKATNAIPVAFSVVTFTGMQPVYLEDGTVSAEEQEDFQSWKQGKREVF